MPETALKPVEDTVAKVDGEVAVGEDLEFQQKWWKFERLVWIIFTLLLLLDVAGVFGRGPVARATRKATDGSLEVKYDRVERTGTPCIFQINIGAPGIHDGKVVLYISQTLVKELGAQRIIPSPQLTEVGKGGLTYTFPASGLPASVELALQPSGPGLHHFVVQVQGAEPVNGDIVVVP